MVRLGLREHLHGRVQLDALHCARGIDATYTTCFANANGDPLAEAACLQDRDACWTADDDAYLACVETCPFDEGVDLNCGEHFGPEITRCYDQHWACLMQGGATSSRACS